MSRLIVFSNRQCLSPRQTPLWGAHSAPPELDLRGPTSKGGREVEGKGEGRRGRGGKGEERRKRRGGILVAAPSTHVQLSPLMASTVTVLW